MTPAQFIANFGAIAEAPDGVQRLRELVETLAVSGRLSAATGSVSAIRACLDNARKASGAKPAKRAVETEKETDWRVRDAPGWLPVRLGELISGMDAGWSPKCESHATESEEEWGVLKTTCVQRNSFEPEHHKALPAKLEPRPHLAVSAGELLVTRAGPWYRVGVAAHVEKCRPRLMLSDKIIRCRYFDDVADGRWLALCVNAGDGAHYLHSTQSGMDKAQMNISQSRLRSLPLLLPPLAEQKRIVAKVDQLMAMLDDLEQRQEKKRTVAIHVSKASLDTLVNAEDPDQLARAWERVSKNFGVVAGSAGGIESLRRLARTLGVRGLLVGQDRSEGAGAEVVRRIAEESEGRRKFGRGESPWSRGDDEPFRLPDSWCWARLPELGAAIDGPVTDGPFGSKLKKSHYVTEPGFRVLRLENVGLDYFKDKGKSYISEPYYEELSTYHLEANDLLVASLGRPPGRACLVPAAALPAINKADCFRIRVHPTVEPRYVAMVLNSSYAIDRALNLHRGDTRGRITLSHLRTTPVPVPPVAEQGRIVARIDQLMAMLDELEVRTAARQAVATKLAVAGASPA